MNSRENDIPAVKHTVFVGMLASPLRRLVIGLVLLLLVVGALGLFLLTNVVASGFGFFLLISALLVWLVNRNWQKSVVADKELKRNYERMELMQEVSQYHASHVQDLLDFSLGKVIALTESSIGYIYHYNEENEQFVLNTWSKGVMDACNVAEPQSVYHLDKTGIWGEVVRQRRPILINDYAAPSELKKGHPDGHVPLSRFLSVPVFDDNRIVAVVGVANKTLPYDQTDVLQLTLMMAGVWRIATRLKLEEHILHAAAESQRFREALDTVSAYIYMKDYDSHYIYANKPTLDLFGCSAQELPGSSDSHFFPSDVVVKLRDVDLRVLTGEHTAEEIEVVTAEGRRVYWEIKSPIYDNQNRAIVWGVLGISTDITDHKINEESLREMHAQLMQQDKLATIGQLAAGVAHEINNPIGFVSSNMITLGKYIEKYNCYIDQLEQEVCSGSTGVLPEKVQALRQSLKLDYVMRDITVLVEENNDGIERVKRIVQDLRTFSRADSAAIGMADLNCCMDSTINIVINEIKYVAELKRDYGALPKILCNAQQINQVFMNLLINAAHAIQAKGEEVGEIIVSTWSDQENVFVSVSDTGCGIVLENCGKIFDAFFTTKEVGKGTGLGLSISAGIIRKHGGEITLVSEVEVGSTFTIRLPLKQKQVQHDGGRQ